MAIDWPRFVELVKAHQRFVLTSHVRPDCDALGSELGMAQVLEALGKEVRIVNAQATPANLRFIDPTSRISVLGKGVSAADLASYDCLMVLDTSAWAQLGGMGDVIRGSQAKKIVLDHHVSQDELGAEVFRNVTAEATGRLVVEAARELKVKLTPQIAMPLFAALATDTGWFRFASTSGETYRFGGQLVDAGASPAAIYNAIYEQDTFARVQLRGRVSGASPDRTGWPVGVHLGDAGGFCGDRRCGRRHRRRRQHDTRNQRHRSSRNFRRATRRQRKG